MAGKAVWRLQIKSGVFFSLRAESPDHIHPVKLSHLEAAQYNLHCCTGAGGAEGLAEGPNQECAL